MSKPRGLARTRLRRARPAKLSIWQKLNSPRELVKPSGKFNPHGKLIAAVIIISLSLSGLFLIDQGLKAQYGFSPVDPYTGLWDESLGSGDLSGWSSNRVNYVADTGAAWSAACATTCPALQLAPDANGPAIAISKTSFNPSQAVSKHLVIDTQFFLPSALSNNKEFGMFITRNSTVPAVGTPDANFNPGNDANVALYMRVAFQTGAPNTLLLNAVMQRDPRLAINSEAYGSSCSGGAGAGSCFQVTTQNAGVGGTTVNALALVLNYTGTSGANGGNGQSIVDLAAVSTFVENLPWFPIQGQTYYMGFFASTGTGIIDFQASSPFPAIKAGVTTCLTNTHDCMIIAVFQFASTPAAPTNSILEGGFFGPLLNALGNALTTAITVIFKFLSFIYAAIVSGLDTVGNFLGLGAVGTAIASVFSAVANWITSVLGTIAAQAIAMVTYVSNGLAVLGQIFTNFWAQITSFFSALKDVLGGFWTVIGDTWGYVNYGGKWVVTGVLLYLMVNAFKGIPEFLEAARMFDMLVFRIFRMSFWILQQAGNAVMVVVNFFRGSGSGTGAPA